MDTVIVTNNQFYSHYPKRIPRGTVNAEAVLIRLDSEWDNLSVRIHWLNVASNVERKPLLERDKPNTIPWEVLTDLGELRMGLVGLDGDTVIKPTIWLTYAYVSDGVDPEAGEDPQPPTPSWEQQMVALAEAAANAAKEAKDAAVNAEKAASQSGPYADEAKKSAEAAKASQDASATSARQANEAAQTARDAVGSIGDSVDRAEGAATEAGEAKQAAETAQAAASNSAGTAQGAATTASEAAQTAQEAATQAGQYLTSVEADANAAAAAATAAGKSQDAAQGAAQTASNARDQATTAANTAQGHATAARTAKDAAEQAATTAGNAQSGAAQSAQSADNSAQAAERAKEEAQNAAAALPAPSPEFAGMVPVVNPEGNGYIFGKAGGGGGSAGGGILLANYTHQGNPEYMIDSFDYETSIAQCSTPHGLTEPTKVFIVPNGWHEDLRYDSASRYIPTEWALYTDQIYLSPVTETSFMVVKSDKTSPITVDLSGENNEGVDVTRLHFESPVNWEINGLDDAIKTSRVQLKIFGYVSYKGARYIQVNTHPEWGWYVSVPSVTSANATSQMLFSAIDLDIDIPEKGAVAWFGSDQVWGRAPNYPPTFAAWKLTQLARVEIISMHRETERSIFQIRNYPGYAAWSNGTTIRVFATGVHE